MALQLAGVIVSSEKDTIKSVESSYTQDGYKPLAQDENSKHVEQHEEIDETVCCSCLYTLIRSYKN